MNSPDFTLFESDIEQHLKNRGVDTISMENGFRLGGNHVFAMFREQCSIASCGDGPEIMHSLALEAKVSGIHPVWMKIEHSEMITLSGGSAEALLKEAAELFFTTTLSAILAISTENFATGIEDDHLNETVLRSAPEGGLDLTTSLPFLKISPEAMPNASMQMFERPMHRFFSNSLADIPSFETLMIITARISKFAPGKYSCDVAVNGEFYEKGSNELQNNYSQFSSNWPEFDAAQTFILQPGSVRNKEGWRTESHDPISDIAAHGSAASCAADQTLNPFHYLRHSQTTQLFLKTGGVFAIIGLVSIFAFGWLIAGGILSGIAILMICLAIRVVRCAKPKFRYTLLTPGIITSISPVNVLVLAPLAKSKFAPDRGDALCYLKNAKLPGHNLTIGERIPIASSFSGRSLDGNYWASFNPEPICWGVYDKEKIEESTLKLGNEEFETLEDYWKSGLVPSEFSGVIKVSDLPLEKPPEKFKKFGTTESNAANVNLKALRYLRYEEGNQCLTKFAGVLTVAGLVAFFLLELKIVGIIIFSIALLILALVISGFLASLAETKEKFKYSLLTGGIVTSLKPLRVLVLAPMAKSNSAPDRGYALRYLEDIKLPGHKVEIGELIPIASSFEDENPDSNYWTDFEPSPLCWGVSDKKEIQTAISRLNREELEKLEGLFTSGRVPQEFDAPLKVNDCPPPLPPASD